MEVAAGPKAVSSVEEAMVLIDDGNNVKGAFRLATRRREVLLEDDEVEKDGYQGRFTHLATLQRSD